MSDRQLANHERAKLIWEADIELEEKATLLALNEFVDGNGECWPGNQRLARMLRKSVGSVKRYISSLEGKGIITRRRRFKPDGAETSSVKRVDFEALRAMVTGANTHPPQSTSDPGGGSCVIQGVDHPRSGGGFTGDPGGGSQVIHDLSNRTDPEEPIQKNTHTHTPVDPPDPTARAGEVAGEGYGHVSSVAATDQRLRRGKALPRWRTGHGPNDYDPAVVEKLRVWLEGLSPGSRRMRADAIAYIRRREGTPGNGDWETLSERVAELMGDSSPDAPRPPAIDIASLAQSAIAAERGGAA